MNDTLPVRRLLIFTGSMVVFAVFLLLIGHAIAALLASGAKQLYTTRTG